MRGTHSGLTVLRAVLAVLAALLVGYLAVLAAWPTARDALPAGLRWFGRPNSAVTIAIVVGVLIALALVVVRSGSGKRPGAPVALIAALAVMSAVLGMASYWRCQDDSHPDFFTSLIWTAHLVKGGDPVHSLDSGACPDPAPVALDIAQLSALSAVFLSVVGVAATLFRSRLDRLRLNFARSATVVVDLDTDGTSMLTAIAASLDPRSTLVVLTPDPDRPAVREARTLGARVVSVDFGRPDTFLDLPIWRKLDKLYLLSSDPSANLTRLGPITAQLSKAGGRQRIPLIVRIDDPWQAASWRATRFGGSEVQWAADTVGVYEVTARRLLDAVLAGPPVDRILVGGSSRLTLALCADLAQRQVERDYLPAGTAPLPALTLVAEDADEYRTDHRDARTRRGLSPDQPEIDTVAGSPSAHALSKLIQATPRVAVILVDAAAGVDTTTGSRLASRFPAVPIYAWDPKAQNTSQRVPLVGQLFTYQLSMDMPDGQAQDSWERAARLIHDRFAAQSTRRTAATRPWSELDAFYRGSNRRQLRNALWMVEKIGAHTWNTWDATPDTWSTTDNQQVEALDQLRRMGFDRTTALAMARAEHEDWCRYYRSAGWTYGEPRDDARKIHDKLTSWDAVLADPERLDAALSSLAGTLTTLRELGYRSRPLADQQAWQRFRRTGEVLAERRDDAWTWTTSSGQTLQAGAGDWLVRDAAGGDPWSVRDDIFRATYEPVGGDRWRRTGTVEARPARAGEVIDTLEGPVTAAEGDWVVRGDTGECWPVAAEAFAERYESVSPARPAGPGTR